MDVTAPEARHPTLEQVSFRRRVNHKPLSSMSPDIDQDETPLQAVAGVIGGGIRHPILAPQMPSPAVAPLESGGDDLPPSN